MGNSWSSTDEVEKKVEKSTDDSSSKQVDVTREPNAQEIFDFQDSVFIRYPELRDIITLTEINTGDRHIFDYWNTKNGVYDVKCLYTIAIEPTDDSDLVQYKDLSIEYYIRKEHGQFMTHEVIVNYDGVCSDVLLCNCASIDVRRRKSSVIENLMADLKLDSRSSMNRRLFVETFLHLPIPPILLAHMI